MAPGPLAGPLSWDMPTDLTNDAGEAHTCLSFAQMQADEPARSDQWQVLMHSLQEASSQPMPTFR